MDYQQLINITILLFIILDPLGNVPFFVSILKNFQPQEQRKIIIREMFISLGIMILFLFFGKEFFSLFKIGDSELMIAGGIILFLIAIKMIFAHPTKERINIKKDPLIVPLSVPAIAGPAILATISFYGAIAESKWLILLAIFIAWLLTLPILLLSSFLKQLLGDNGLIALERLMGFVVVLLAIQMMLNGIFIVYASYGS